MRTTLLALVVFLGFPMAAGAAAYPKPRDHETKGANARVMIIHGGGWRASTPEYLDAMKPIAKAFQDKGFSTTVASYHAGSKALGDVLTIYDNRRKKRPKQPICLWGNSAGGQLAMMLAAKRKSVRCVVAEAAPTDLTALPPGSASDMLARQAFGTKLAENSPIRYASKLPKTLLVMGKDDPIVPLSQGTALRHAVPESVRLIKLNAGKAGWEHGTARVVGVAISSVSELSFVKHHNAP